MSRTAHLIFEGRCAVCGCKTIDCPGYVVSEAIQKLSREKRIDYFDDKWRERTSSGKLKRGHSDIRFPDEGQKLFDHGIYQIALEWRMSLNGSAAFRSTADMHLEVSYMLFRLNNWVPSLPRCHRADEAVREFLKAVLIEGESRYKQLCEHTIEAFPLSALLGIIAKARGERSC